MSCHPSQTCMYVHYTKQNIDKCLNGNLQDLAITAEEQLLVTLRSFATGIILQVVEDFHGIHKITIGKIIKKF